ncbi:DNA repair protein rhp7-like [Senna tora]|uniref:DNA repair protein rhp7-like n=1 Tax=Senna tora TaxID=362788 RepID=A0A834U4S6_9FABA|nr:DNA repair protein rhp7-like [Senna tora]
MGKGFVCCYFEVWITIVSGRKLTDSSVKVGHDTALSLASRAKKLHTLDLSWYRNLTENEVGLIVDSCFSLKLLKLFGSRQRRRMIKPGPEDPSLLTLQTKHVSEAVCQGYPERTLRFQRWRGFDGGRPPARIVRYLMWSGFYGVSRLTNIGFEGGLILLLQQLRCSNYSTRQLLQKQDQSTDACGGCTTACTQSVAVPQDQLVLLEWADRSRIAASRSPDGVIQGWVGVQRIHPHEVHGRVGGLEPTMGNDPMPTCVPRSGNLRFPSGFCLSHCTAHDTSGPVLQNPNCKSQPVVGLLAMRDTLNKHNGWSDPPSTSLR